MTKQNKTIVFIDSNALAHRAFHAYPPTLMTKKGEPTNAIYGFFSMFVQVITTLKPDSIICVFDAPGGNFRDAIYEKYKANRPEMDGSLVEQIPKMISTLRDANIQTLTIPGFEADDVIGSLVNSEHLTEYNKIIVTGDRDLFQVLNKSTQVYLAGNPFSSSKLFNRESASEKMGFDVDRILLFKALKGDPSDNIPGVPGIGDMTAMELVKDYETLDDIYKNINIIKPSIAAKLEKGMELAKMSQQLAQIKIDMDFHIDLDNLDIDKINIVKLKEAFQNFEFSSLYRRIDSIFKKTIENETHISEELKDEMKFKNIEINTTEGFVKMCDEIKKEELMAIYSEINKDIFQKVNRLNITIKDFSYLINLDVLNSDELNTLFKVIKSKKVVTYDGKYLKHVFATLGFEGFKFDEDVLLFEFIASMGLDKSTIDEVYSSENSQGSLFDESPLYKQTQFVYKKGVDIAKNKALTLPSKMLSLYEDIEIPLSNILYKVESNGIQLNPKELVDLEEELNTNIAQIEKKIFADAGEEFNIASPKQLAHILFDKLGIKGGKKNKSGAFSTNEKFLLNNVSIPIIENIIVYRELYKLRSTYTRTLINQINKKSHRVHSTFNQCIAITGRLSSIDPNLQNIPTNTDWGLRIRKAFVAPENKLLLSLDYSQQELRLLAEFSKDENLRMAFENNIDIHAFTASKIFKIPVDQVTPAQRRSAKTVNFGVVYGISAFGLGDRLKISNQESQTFIDGFYAGYPMVAEYFKELKNSAKEKGYVETYFGRRRNAQMIDSDNYQLRMAAEREIINFPLQGSAAEIIKVAMIDVNKIIDEKYSDFAIMILQVHDEIIFEINTQSIDDKRLIEFVKEIKYIMNEGVKMEVPMLVEAKAGTNWAELNKLNIN